MSKCPNCGGSLKFDIPSQKMKCDSCASLFGPYEIKEGGAEESTEYDVDKFIVTESAAKTYFRTDGAAFFYATRDGIKYYSDMDKLMWTDIYTLASPNIIFEEEKCCVIALKP